MTIEIKLNEEQTDALNDAMSAANALLGKDDEPFTAETYLSDRLLKAVNSYVKQAYDISVARLGEAASQLDYQARKALISQIETSITK